MSVVVDVIVCLPVYNCDSFLDEALESVLSQTYRGGIIAIGAFDDGSSDNSFGTLQRWQTRVQASDGQFRMKIARNLSRATAHGVAYARNCAVELGRQALNDRDAEVSAVVVVFLDADDAMMSTRIERQVHCMTDGFSVLPSVELLCGTRFERIPIDATPRYTAWHNELEQPNALHAQMFRETTVAQPTWALTLARFDALGGYSVRERCEDLDLLYRHVERGGRLVRVDEVLTRYRYNLAGASHAIGWLELLSIKMRAFERLVLERHVKETFCIWGAGRDGKRFFRALSDKWQRRVAAFCDVDEAKLKQGVFNPPPPYRCEIRARIDADAGRATWRSKTDYVTAFGAATCAAVPIVTVDDARIRPPIVTCVALDRTEGEFEASIPTHWVQGVDVWHFS
jgi:glycosyltransferase involved in cell wall biosynthesis